jgi:hypothetical protein
LKLRFYKKAGKLNFFSTKLGQNAAKLTHRCTKIANEFGERDFNLIQHQRRVHLVKLKTMHIK